MKTITAKELRDDLEKVVQGVKAGQTYTVTYRSKAAFAIVPKKNTDQPLPGSYEARRSLKTFFKENRKNNMLMDLGPDDYKRLYHEHLDEKYGSS